MTPPEFDVATLNALSPGPVPGLIGFQVTEVERGLVRARLEVHEQLLAPNGYLHAAVVIGLVDTVVRIRLSDLPARRRDRLHDDRAQDRTSVRTLTAGVLRATPGSSTAAARPRCGTPARSAPTTSDVALFRCTQLVLR